MALDDMVLVGATSQPRPRQLIVSEDARNRLVVEVAGPNCGNGASVVIDEGDEALLLNYLMLREGQR